MMGFSALGQYALGEPPPLGFFASVIRFLRTTLEEQSVRHRSKYRYRTFGR